MIDAEVAREIRQVAAVSREDRAVVQTPYDLQAVAAGDAVDRFLRSVNDHAGLRRRSACQVCEQIRGKERVVLLPHRAAKCESRRRNQGSDEKFQSRTISNHEDTNANKATQ